MLPQSLSRLLPIDPLNLDAEHRKIRLAGKRD